MIIAPAPLIAIWAATFRHIKKLQTTQIKVIDHDAIQRAAEKRQRRAAKRIKDQRLG